MKEKVTVNGKEYDVNQVSMVIGDKEIKTEPTVITVNPFPVLDWELHLEDKKEVTEDNIDYWEGQIGIARYYEKDIKVPCDIHTEILRRFEKHWIGNSFKEKLLKVKNLVKRLKNRNK